VPTVTIISSAFAPLAQVVGEGIGHMSLPIVVVPHPVGNPDRARVVGAGRDVAQECARILTTEVGALEREFEGKQYPLPRGMMPR
jgi:hypothetical protein